MKILVGIIFSVFFLSIISSAFSVSIGGGLSTEKNKEPLVHGTPAEIIFFAFMYSCWAITISYLIYRYYCRGMSEKERHQKLRSFLKKYKIISWDRIK